MALTKNTLILFIAAVCTALFGYLFNPLVTARALAPEGFAALGVFLSLNHILSFPQRPLGLSLNRSIAKYDAQGDHAKIGALLRYTFKKLVQLGIPCLLLLFILSPVLSNYLKLETTTPVIAAILFAYAGLFLKVIKVSLQGTLQFTRLAFVTTSDAFFRAVVGGSLFLIGVKLGLFKIISVYIASYVTVALLCTWLLRKTIWAKGEAKIQSLETPSSITSLWIYSIFTAAVVSIDMITVKHYFSSADAGIYIAAAGLSKMLFLLTTPIGTVNYSLMCHRVAENKPMTDLLYKSLGATVLFCLAFLGGIALFSNLLVHLSYGKAFAASVDLLLYTSIAFCPFTLTVIFGQYFLAKKSHTFVGLLIMGAIAQYLFIHFHHDTIREVISAYTAGGVLQLALVAGLYLFSKKK